MNVDFDAKCEKSDTKYSAIHFSFLAPIFSYFAISRYIAGYTLIVKLTRTQKNVGEMRKMISI